jgi:hypothetical protein
MGEGDDPVRVADVERVADERHAEGLVQALQEGLAGLGGAVAVRVAEQRDPVGADAQRGGAPHRRGHGVVEDAPRPAARHGQGLGDQDVAVGQDVHPAGMLEAGSEGVDLQPGGGDRGLSRVPAAGRRHLEGRHAPCGLAGGIEGAPPVAGSRMSSRPCRHRIVPAPISATIRPKASDKIMVLLSLVGRTLAEAGLDRQRRPASQWPDADAWWRRRLSPVARPRVTAVRVVSLRTAGAGYAHS